MDPSEAQRIFQTANCLREMGRYHEARDLLLQAIELYPDFTEFYYLLGNVCLDLGEVKGAEQAFLTCLEKGEGCSPGAVPGAGTFLAHYHLGLIYEMVGAEERASLHYCQAARYGHALAELKAALMGRSCFRFPEGAG